MLKCDAIVTIENVRHKAKLKIVNGSVEILCNNLKLNGNFFCDFRDVAGSLFQSKLTVEFKIPFHLKVDNEVRETTLYIVVNSMLSDVDFQLNLSFQGMTLESKNSNMEYAIINLRNDIWKINRKVDIMTCISCRFSSFNPFGNMDFGDLWCLKKHSEVIAEIKNKNDLINFMTDKTFKITEEISFCEKYSMVGPNDYVYSDWKYNQNA